ncbi:MAG: DUF6305 family protein [Acetomicrobium sp.]|jgi:hypothetical protein|nr:hypothetical protein [Synergistaceae bacterium]HPT64584.1 DUF6305 family protein [Acetomicrobium sp.]
MYKNKIFRLILSFLFAILFCHAAFAASNIALTSAGQSPDAMMVKVVLKKMDVEVDFDSAMDPAAIKDNHKVLIVVVGGSSKGLGAAGIDQDQEKARIEEILKIANEKGLKILVMHVGGASRRGTLSDLFLDTVVPHADYVIYVKGANEDGYFTKVSEEKKIPVEESETIRALDEHLKKVLGEWGVI